MTSGPDAVPACVLFHLWQVAGRDVPRAMLRMASTRRAVRRTAGLRFAKLLGTGRGRSFLPSDADVRHWGLLTCWQDAASSEQFLAGSTVLRSWRRIAAEELTLRLGPVASRGEWSGQEPFGRPSAGPVTGPVASITRARISVRRSAAFWRAVPPVAADLRSTPGLLLAIGIGEAPVGVQGTLSVWSDTASLIAFAHRREPHLDVLRRTAAERWYAEELFARFTLLQATGTHRGQELT